jgi:hypothetical protein
VAAGTLPPGPKGSISDHGWRNRCEKVETRLILVWRSRRLGDESFYVLRLPADGVVVVLAKTGIGLEEDQCGSAIGMEGGEQHGRKTSLVCPENRRRLRACRVENDDRIVDPAVNRTHTYGGNGIGQSDPAAVDRNKRAKPAKADCALT